MFGFAFHDGGRPDGAWNDCAVRSIAVALNEPYADVYQGLANLMRKRERRYLGKATPRHVATKYLAAKGWRYFPGNTAFPPGPVLLVVQFSAQYPRGDHVTAMIDGVLHDTFDWRGQAMRVLGFYAPVPSAFRRITRKDLW